MESSSDDDDKFLYGSDFETLPEATSTQSKRRNVSELSETSVKRARFSSSTGVGTGESPVKNTANDRNNDNDNDNDDADANDSDNSYSDSDSDSDSDVDFIISTGPDTTRLDMDALSSTASTTNTTATATTTMYQSLDDASKADTIRIATELASPNGESAIATGAAGSGSGSVAAATATLEGSTVDGTGFDVGGAHTGANSGGGSVDLDEDGLFDGQPITQLDPEVLKEKPWRQPGANLADYFNYGFNEYTWMEYLNRQEKLRQEYNPRRVLMGLLSLQQQGKLDPQQPMQNKNMGSSGHNDFGMNKQLQNKIQADGAMKNTQHTMLQPPPTFPSLPMFGGFPPFPMSGMMPMNPQSNKKQQR